MPIQARRDFAVAWFLAIWPIPVGLTISLFQDRFTSASWRFAAGMPGGYTFWAGALIAFGIVMVYALHRHSDNLAHNGAYHSGLIGTGLWWVFLGSVFAYTAYRDPLANPLGATTWTGIGLLYWLYALYEQQRILHWLSQKTAHLSRAIRRRDG